MVCSLALSALGFLGFSMSVLQGIWESRAVAGDWIAVTVPLDGEEFQAG